MNEALQLWPVVFIVDDGYVPQMAQVAIDLVKQVDEQTIAAAWACHAYAAQQEAERRMN